MSDSDRKVNLNIYPDAVTRDRTASVGHYPTFYTLMSVGRKKLSVCQNNVAAFSCCCKVL